LATLLSSNQNSFFQTRKTINRVSNAFGRAYAPVPDRRTDVLNFIKDSVDTPPPLDHRYPIGIMPPTTPPTPYWFSQVWRDVINFTLGPQFDSESTFSFNIYWDGNSTGVDVEASAFYDVGNTLAAIVSATVAALDGQSGAPGVYHYGDPNHFHLYSNFANHIHIRDLVVTGEMSLSTDYIDGASKAVQIDLSQCNGKEFETELYFDGAPVEGGTVAFTINDYAYKYDKTAVNITIGATPTAESVATQVYDAITGTHVYNQAGFTVTRVGSSLIFEAKEKTGCQSVPFVLPSQATITAGIASAGTLTITKSVLHEAAGLENGDRVQFAYQFYSPARGVYSELSPWSAPITIAQGKRPLLTGFESPRDGVHVSGNRFGIVHILVYAKFDTSIGYCDIGSMVIDKTMAVNGNQWNHIFWFDMTEDSLVQGIPEPAVGTHEIPPSVSIVEPHGPRLLLAGQAKKRFAPASFPSITQVTDANGNPKWPDGTTISITSGQRHRVDAENFIQTRAECAISGCFIDDSYLWCDLYVEGMRIGTVMDIARDIVPYPNAPMPHGHTPPYHSVFYLDVDWKGKPINLSTDFYFIGHPNRIWVTGYDTEQTSLGEAVIRPESVHPLHYFDVSDDIVDIRSTGQVAYVLCKNSTYILTGGSTPGAPSDIQIQKIDDVVGCVSPQSTVMLPSGDVFFLSKDGPYIANTGGVRAVSPSNRRLFIGKSRGVDVPYIHPDTVSKIKSSLAMSQDAPFVILAGYKQGETGAAAQGWAVLNIMNGEIWEQDGIEFTSNVLGSEAGICPPITGDRLGRIKTVLDQRYDTDLDATSLSNAPKPFVCRLQDGIYTFSGEIVRPTRLRVVTACATGSEMTVLVRAGDGMLSPIPENYSASETKGWKTVASTGGKETEAVTITDKDMGFDVYLNPCMGTELTFELRWDSDNGPHEISRLEILGI
jgi:hypothetical protein